MTARYGRCGVQAQALESWAPMGEVLALNR